MKRKYPFKHFIFFVLLSFFVKRFYLFLPGLVFTLVGSRSKICLALGLALLITDLIISIVDQLQIRDAALSESSNPEFNELMDQIYGEGDPNALSEYFESKQQSYRDAQAQQDSQRHALLEKLIVYRTLKETIHSEMTLDEMMDAFSDMCQLSVGEPDDLLFETGTYTFEGTKAFSFSLVRQFSFFGDSDEYVQLRLDIRYPSSWKTRLMYKVKWWNGEPAEFFHMVKSSLPYHAVKDKTPVKVVIHIDET